MFPANRQLVPAIRRCSAPHGPSGILPGSTPSSLRRHTARGKPAPIRSWSPPTGWGRRHEDCLALETPTTAFAPPCGGDDEVIGARSARSTRRDARPVCRPSRSRLHHVRHLVQRAPSAGLGALTISRKRPALAVFRPTSDECVVNRHGAELRYAILRIRRSDSGDSWCDCHSPMTISGCRGPCGALPAPRERPASFAPARRWPWPRRCVSGRGAPQ